MSDIVGALLYRTMSDIVGALHYRRLGDEDDGVSAIDRVIT